MSVLQMQRISICALKKDRKAILEELQELGVLEIETSKVTADGLDRPDTAEEKQRSEKQALMLDQALDVLQEYAPEKTSIFASLEGKKLVARDSFLAAVKEREAILESAGKILSLKKKEAEKHEQIHHWHACGRRCCHHGRWLSDAGQKDLPQNDEKRQKDGCQSRRSHGRHDRQYAGKLTGKTLISRKSLVKHCTEKGPAFRRSFFRFLERGV